MDAVQATADALQVTLENMKSVEEMRRNLRKFRDADPPNPTSPRPRAARRSAAWTAVARRPQALGLDLALGPQKYSRYFARSSRHFPSSFAQDCAMSAGSSPARSRSTSDRDPRRRHVSPGSN